MVEPKRALVVGGTSGLGLEIGRCLSKEGWLVYFSGRKPRAVPGRFMAFDTEGERPLNQRISEVVNTLPGVDLFVYAAGFYQEGSITELSPGKIDAMLNVGLLAPALFIREILRHYRTLTGFIAITSTSQWTPRVYEPVYTAVKAGLAMLANSLSLDDCIGKTLVAAPAGMRTHFWDSTDKDTSTMLDPAWVAEEVIRLYAVGDYRYRFAKILRDPPRVEVAETRIA